MVLFLSNLESPAMPVRTSVMAGCEWARRLSDLEQTSNWAPPSSRNQSTANPHGEQGQRVGFADDDGLVCDGSAHRNG